MEVAGSSPVTRSKQIRNAQGVPYFIRYRGQVVRQESAKLSFASSNLAGTSMFTQHFRCNLEKVASKVFFWIFIENIIDISLNFVGKM